MKKVVVVILNFMNYRETFRCVDSVLPQEDVELEIVIVDNGSLNESYQELRKRYINNKLIHVLRSNKNYGFARGNNIGINYAKQKLSADFVLVLNSDIELLQSNYISALISEYKENIGVIGSKIIQRRGFIQENYQEYTNFPDTLFFYIQLIFEYYGFPAFYKKIGQLLEKTEKTEILHGSCFMLTPSFFEHYTMLYDRTFLYMEEVLLSIYCQNAHLAQLKTEEAVVLHKGRQSSKYLYENKGFIKRKYIIKSYKYVVWESFKTYLKNKNTKNEPRIFELKKVSGE